MNNRIESGIYKIKNINNNKIYIGSSVNIKERKWQHVSNLKNNKHPNIHLQRAFNKYGEKAFIFEIIELCDIIVLIEKEQYYINTLNPEYNICKIAHSVLGVKRSTKTKEKMRKAQLGRKVSNDTKKKLSKAHKGKKYALGSRHSIEAKKKIGKYQQKAVIQFTTDGKYIQEFSSIKEASTKTGIHNGNIGACCKYEAGLISNRKTAGGFRWKYQK